MDIFSQAQAMQQKKDLGSNVQIAAPPMFVSGGPDQQTPQNPAEQTQQQLKDLLPKPSGPAQSSQDIMKAIGLVGVDNKNLPMNEVGKNLLIKRFRDKYGDEYKNMPEAQNALSMFDQHLEKYSDMAANSQTQMMSQADTTLSALKDWSLSGNV